MAGSERMTAATCLTCGRQLTASEFHACSGIGHYCGAHLSGHGGPVAKPAASRPQTRPASSGGKRSSRVSESGAATYPCKAQFAGTGVIRRGRLTRDHPSSVQGNAVFVWEGVGYGPGEIVTLFIKNAEGRALARKAGFDCRA